ncbi:hypothetical protein COP1_012762 [Malus domestica]
MDRAVGSVSHPPYFNGENYGDWKAKMKSFLWALDYRVWSTVVHGYTFPTKIVQINNKKKSYDSKDVVDDLSEVVVPTPREEWTTAEVTHSTNNQRGLNALFTAVSPDQFIFIRNCETSKEAWDILQDTNEGTETEKEEKLEVFTSQFERIKMEEDETFPKFYAKLCEIVNNCYNLGETIPESQIVKKVLRSLPHRFQPKKTALTEVRNLKTLKLSKLVGALKTYEMELPPQPKKSKSINLHAVKEDYDQGEGVSEEEFSLLTKQFQKFLKNKNCRGKSGSTSKNVKPNFSFGKNSKVDKIENTTDKRKSMLASWSESESESDEESNIIAFVAHVDAGIDETKDWDDETVIEKYQELYQASLKIKKQNDVLKEKAKILEFEKTKTESDFQSQVTELEKQLDGMVQKLQQLRDRISDQNKLITSLSTEHDTLKYQLHES